jgi:peptidoglycan/LPS O-acetylase OafA/YrhL
VSAPEPAHESLGAQRKLAYIDGMRGVAALYVVLGHICNMVDPLARVGRETASPDWLVRLMSPFWYGHLAVAAFIVISGFCLQMSLFDRGDGRFKRPLAFFSRRARRILPAYWACLGVSIIVALTVTTSLADDPRFAQYLPVDQDTVLSHIFLYHNFDPSLMYKINGALWSIAIEAQLYVLFPLLCMGIFWFGRLPWLGLVTTGIVLVFPSLPIKSYIWFLGLFLLGMVFAHFAYRPAPRIGTKYRWFIWGGVVSLLGGLYIANMARMDPTWGPRAESLVGLATAAFLYAGLVAPWSVPARVFGLRLVAGIGIFSYSLYLMHHPIQQVMYAIRPSWANGAENELLYLGTIGLVTMLAVSYIFYRIFERPFMTRRRRRAEAAEESRIMQGETTEPRPVALSLETFYERSAYGLGRRRSGAIADTAVVADELDIPAAERQVR